VVTEAQPTPLLELEDVQKAFGSVVVADRFSIRVGRGETLGIVGPNGAGKTSVLNLVTGNLRPDGGRIFVDGTEITRLTPHARARLGIGRTYQIPRPFGGMTVFENVLLGATFAGRDRTEQDGHGDHDPATVTVEALDRTGLLECANLPAGALPLLDRKRLELARAIAIRPTLLLLDEIAGGLTEREVDELMATMRALRAEGLTIVWIEHIVAALLSVVDRLVAMDGGRIVAEGEPATVLADPAVHAVYLGQEPVVGQEPVA
jgi:branched-chain amino acid transport system ATP-binding protein